ncbi:uncharacterized protein LOC112341462 [Selaginella moellendorffii]|uniref:uncharacterized protein LOC112341462 n=1 Tax=Selaginella moellendorffii TaxID=88036 RepID=UPI000D1CCA29|nr:uncharacterized protein LOC112341462 [Selaginella moellendorffii]|eukprot:XP_024517348.1 uncharacterized protein LOC112341462 [Selaginella moellendorffii]
MHAFWTDRCVCDRLAVAAGKGSTAAVETKAKIEQFLTRSARLAGMRERSAREKREREQKKLEPARGRTPNGASTRRKMEAGGREQFRRLHCRTSVERSGTSTERILSWTRTKKRAVESWRETYSANRSIAPSMDVVHRGAITSPWWPLKVVEEESFFTRVSYGVKDP